MNKHQSTLISCEAALLFYKVVLQVRTMDDFFDDLYTVVDPGPFIFDCDLCQEPVYGRPIELMTCIMRFNTKWYNASSHICKSCYDYAIFRYLGESVIIVEAGKCLEVTKRYRNYIRKSLEAKNKRRWDKIKP